MERLQQAQETVGQFLADWVAWRTQDADQARMDSYQENGEILLEMFLGRRICLSQKGKKLAAGLGLMLEDSALYGVENQKRV
jgi:hypothetical protein